MVINQFDAIFALLLIIAIFLAFFVAVLIYIMVEGSRVAREINKWVGRVRPIFNQMEVLGVKAAEKIIPALNAAIANADFNKIKDIIAGIDFNAFKEVLKPEEFKEFSVNCEKLIAAADQQ